MKKITTILVSVGAFAISANAFEFGYMGNRSFGMGGAGVGIANSAWGLYYNPALQGVDNKYKIGYSLGARIKEHGLSKLKDFNLSNIQNGSTAQINSILKDNEVAITSENGVVVQIPLHLSARISQSIGAGFFYTKRGAINFTGYLNGNNTTSLDKANNAFMVTNTLDTLEVPVSYTIQVYTGGFGTFHAGIALKYIYAGHSASKSKLTNDINITNATNEIFKSPSGARTHTAGIDIGFAYAAPNEWMVIGVVAKNINSPVLKAQRLVDTNGTPANNDKLKMDAQYRLGISTRAIPMTTLAVDFDLKPNYEFSGFNTKVDSTANSIGVIRKEVQYISFGTMLNAGLLDLRLGAAKDIKEKNAKDGWLVSAGIGFGYFDFSFFSSTKMSKVVKNLPTEFGFKLGGSFSF
ncbi:conjugal transfer protein TraF [Helicobacter sp. 23-1044]